MEAADTQDADPAYPVRAIAFMERNGLEGNFLTAFVWGEYVLWRCYPQIRVGMCGRYETVYTEAYTRQYFDFVGGKNNWQQFLAAYPHDYALFASNGKVDGMLRSLPDWWEVYRDDRSVLYANAARKPDGRGKKYWPNGNSYAGDYKNGKPHGTGAYRWANGSTYTGAFQNGVGHGHGVMHYADGRVREGELENGKFKP